MNKGPYSNQTVCFAVSNVPINFLCFVYYVQTKKEKKNDASFREENAEIDFIRLTHTHTIVFVLRST